MTMLRTFPVRYPLRRLYAAPGSGTVYYDDARGIETALPVPVDADTVQYVRGIDMGTGLPVYIDASTLVGGGGGGLSYQGTWNATTNSPAIPAADPSNNGWYYFVATAGTTAIDGISDWGVGDWIISNGATWQKIDNSETVTAVFGRTGAVVAVAGDYPETKGGTGQTAYVLGDLLYANATNTLARLPGNTAATRKFLRSLGAAGVATAPVWDTLVAGDLPTVPYDKGGTGLTTVALGDLLYGASGSAWAKLAGNANNRRQWLVGKAVAGVAQAPAWEDFTFTINLPLAGAGVVIPVGYKLRLMVDFDCEVEAATLLGDASNGSIVVDLEKTTYAGYAGSGVSVCASARPTITTAWKSQDTTLTGWTTAWAAGSIILVNVISCSVFQDCTLALKLRRT
jgi:hypothetical protein